MPIYEYECCSCQHQFETLFLSCQEEEKLACPQCGKKEVRRMMSPAGILGAKCASGPGTRFS